MTDLPSARLERRHHARIIAKGTATLRTPDDTQRGRIANLGAGGMLVTLLGPGPDRLLGRAVEIEVRLDGRHAEWLNVTGRVIEVRGDSLAVSFDTAPEGLLRMLDEHATASRASARIVSVVLIDADSQRRAAMVAGFRATGCAVLEGATPLEAIIHLGESSFEPDVIAVANSHPSTSAEEMRAFIGRYHPNAKLVTIGDELLEPDGIAHWLSSSDPRTDLPRRIREVLARPRPKTQP